MGADDRMLRRHSTGVCVCRDCTHPRDAARGRAFDARDAAARIREQWGEALDLIGGICPACRHSFEAARPNGGDGIYTWCGATGCTCAHHEDPISRPR